jgi:acyl dehydratase
MPELPVSPGARWFEDWSLGDVVVSQGRTITEADLMAWCGLTGDFNAMHVDEDFAREHSPFGTRIPQGLLAVAVASGLQERLGIFGGTGRGMLGQTISYRSPVHIGDTIHVELEAGELKDRADRPYGKLVLAYRIRRTDGTVCIEGDMTLLVANRP